ncbi:MAG: polysaccharide deacetylase [Candidimonas sp.]
MKHPVVCLSFDFDALSLWLARSMNTPTPLSRGEFCAVGAKRVLELLHKFDLPSTWFIPGHTIESYPDVVSEVIEAGHEIGNHGWTHVPPARMSRDEEEHGLLRANESIFRVTGKYPRGYRSPSWDLSSHTVDLLLKHGFEYDSSMMGTDYVPYFVRQGDIITLDQPAIFGKPTSILELPVSWSLDDYPHFEFVRSGDSVIPGLKSASNVLENFVEDFLYLKESIEWGMIIYTFHPFVIGRGHRMRMLERLLVRLREEGAQFMTMEDAMEAHKQRSSQITRGLSTPAKA